MRHIAASITFAIGITFALHAQQAPPTFTSAVELVTLDVRIVDQNGQFVRDLARDDVKVFEDGREQVLTAFDRISIPVRTADEHEREFIDAGRITFAGEPVVPDVADNGGQEPDVSQSRLYVLLMDDLHTNPARSGDVRAEAREFIEHHFAPEDRAIVVMTSGRLRNAQGFTNDRGRLLQAIDSFAGDVGFAARAMCQASGANAVQCATSDDVAALHSLASVATWLAPIAGQRKAVLFFGEGLSVDQAAFILGPDPAAIDPSAPPGDTASGNPSQSPGGVRLTQKIGGAVAAYGVILPALQAAEDAATRANVTVYPLDPRRHPESEFPRIVTDTSSYYLLGYVPTNGKHDGTFRKVEVRPLRPGLRVEARKGYTAKTDSAPGRAVPTDVSAALAEMPAGPLPGSGLPMRVSALPFAGNSSKASVEVILDVQGRDLVAASQGRGSVALLMSVVDSTGDIRASERALLDMNLSTATRDQVAQHGLRVLSRLNVAPGRYVLRVAGVDDRNSSRGSVQLDLDVPDFSKGALTMSGLALASASDISRPTTGSDNAWQERFEQPPTTTRAFSDTDDILVSGEIYQNGQTIDVDTVTTLRTVSGEVVFHAERTQSDGTTGSPSVRRFQTVIPLGGLNRGDYLLVVEASQASNPKENASRQVPLTVR